MRKLFFFLFGIFVLVKFSFSQNVVVNSSGASGDASAGLDVDFTNKGLLVPRMTQAQRDALSSPATSLLIYQTNNTSGYYFNSGTPGTPIWSRFLSTASSGTSWTLAGNATTTPGTDFIGTSDNQDLVFKTNNAEVARIQADGFVAIGTSSPQDFVHFMKNVNDATNLHITNTNAGSMSSAGISIESDVNSGFFGVLSTGYSESHLAGNVGMSALSNNLVLATMDAGDIFFNTNGLTSSEERMRITSTGNLGIGTSAPSSLIHFKNGHIRSEQTTAPTIAVTTQNGITASAVTAGSTDTKGNITTTGTNNGTNTVLTITFNTAYTIAPTVMANAANASAQACQSFVSSTTTTFVLTFSGGGATPSFNYFIIE